MHHTGIQHSRLRPRRRGLFLLAALPLLAASALAGELPCGGDDEGFTASFRLDDCKFKPTGVNPYFILKPGRRLVLEGDGERLLITVLPKTRIIEMRIDGERRKLKTRVVEEREFEDGELKEVSRNFFAICSRTNDVFYFGEEVDIYENCEIVTHEGAWQAGKDGALPGIIMPGTFLLGARYFQEIACDVAMDRGENIAMELTIETPFGVLEDCVEVTETSPLEPGSESRKVYAPGIGIVIDGDLELVDVIEHVGHGDEDEGCEPGDGDDEGGD